jgi:hypothetical protein
MRAFLLGAVLAVGTHAQPPTPQPAAAARPAPPPATSAPVSSANVIEPNGPAPLARGGETVVDPASAFGVDLAGRVADARLVLLDGADAHVPARSTLEVGATTRLALTPAAPLVPGSRYVLRVEGAATRELHGEHDAYAPVAFQVVVAGTPPPPEPKKKKAKKRGRR